MNELCKGMMDCYPNCDECPRYQDDCSGSEQQWAKEEAEEAK